MGITEKLAKVLLDTNYDDLPKEAINAAKDRILDSLGAMIGGSPERVTQILIKYVKRSGGVAEAGVIGGGIKTSLTNAVFINGTSGHALEVKPGWYSSWFFPDTASPDGCGSICKVLRSG